MVANQQYDFSLQAAGQGAKGFMLVRPSARSGAGRAWRRSSVPNIPGSPSPGEGRFNNVSPALRFSEVYDDFSGGYGFAYRGAAPPNGIHWSENLDTRYQGQAVHCQRVVPLTSGSPANAVAFCDVELGGQPGAGPPLPNPIGGGRVLVVGVAGAQRLTPRTDGAFDVAADGTLANLVGKPATFGSAIYVGAVGGSGFYRTNIAAANGGTLSDLSGQVFVAAGARLWRFHGQLNGDTPGRAVFAQNLSVLDRIGALSASNWSATLSLGNANAGIQDAIEINGQVFAGTPRGILAGDQSGTFINVTGNAGSDANIDNFRDLCVHNGEIIGPHVNGIYAYDPTTAARSRVRAIGPVSRSARSPIVGRHRCVTSFGGWMYAGLWTGSQSYIQAGREVGPDDWRWYTLQRLPNLAQVHRLHFDGITVASSLEPIPTRAWVATNPSVNFGAVTGTAPIYAWPVPAQNGNPLAPDMHFSANYCGSARLVLPRSDRNAPGVPKIFEFVDVWADGFHSGSRYADVDYTLDDGARTLLGRAQTSPVSRLYFTASNPSFYTGRALAPEIESFTTTSATTPVYRAVIVEGVMRPDSIETIQAVAHIGDNLSDRRGQPMRPGAVQIDELHAFADPARLGNQQLTLTDLAGATLPVVVVGGIDESELYQDGQRDPEVAATVTLAVLTVSGAVP